MRTSQCDYGIYWLDVEEFYRELKSLPSLMGEASICHNLAIFQRLSWPWFTIKYLSLKKKKKSLENH